MKKKVGVVCDNYKVEKFKAELIKHDFTEFTVHAFIDQTSTIKVIVHEVRLKELTKLIKRIEHSFKNSN